MSSRHFEFEGTTALVTGAASGIGAQLAMQLAAKGVHLALADIEEDGLQSIETQCRKHNIRVSSHKIDLSESQSATQLANEVMHKHGELSLLFNNAGVALGGSFRKIPEQDFDWLMAINFSTPVKLVRALLPELDKAAEARIVNISSLFGLVAPPGQTAYSASKFALRGFSEALRHELAESNIGMTVVHPGGVATSIARNAKIPGEVASEDLDKKIASMEKQLRMPADKAAGIILDAVKRRKNRILVGTDARIIDKIQRFFPGYYWGYMKRLVS